MQAERTADRCVCIWLVLLFGPISGSSDSRETMCLCIDTFSSFMSNTNQAYRDDIARRLDVESRVGAKTRAALADVWDNVKQTYESAQLMHILPQQQQAVCEVGPLHFAMATA